MTRMELFGAVKLGLEGEWLGGCEKCVCPKKLQRRGWCFEGKSRGGHEMSIRRQGKETVVQHGKRYGEEI